MHTTACDIRPGDTVRLPDEPGDVKVVDRDYPDFTCAAFELLLADGRRRRIGKLTHVEIDDPDGSVMARVVEINLSGLPAGGER